MHLNVSVTPFDAAAILIVLAALLGYLNLRFVKLPPSVGITAMGALASLAVIGVNEALPESHLATLVARFVDNIDFHRALMGGMLSFLLFAGALHVNWRDMRRGRWPVLILSTGGVVVSTLCVGVAFHAVTQALALPVPLIWCFVFGALISPTDPVAVMAVLKGVDVSPTLRATVSGESLFNDGVGVVIFTLLLAAALGETPLTLGAAGRMFALEAGGGVLLGLAIGWLAYGAMRSIDDYNIEVMLTLATVMGGYALARQLHVSGPVAMAVAGLLIGNRGVATAMSEITKDYLIKFWSIIDNILNSVLFLLIGLVIVTIKFDLRVVLLGFIAIPIVLAVRTVSVLVPLVALRPFLSLGRLAPATLIWGGLRGGISVALALGLPPGPPRSTVLSATYIVVLFSVIVQGATIGPLLARLSRRGRE
jgi:CPA1 family monovalent cation:H+ antiporter